MKNLKTLDLAGFFGKLMCLENLACNLPEFLFSNSLYKNEYCTFGLKVEKSAPEFLLNMKHR